MTGVTAEAHRTTEPRRVRTRLARLVALASEIGPARRVVIGGIVTDVRPADFEIAGLGNHAVLGDRISIDVPFGQVPGEIVRIGIDGATARTFDPRLEIGPGAIAFHAGPAFLSPCHGWSGRAIDPLGHPIDGGGALPGGGRQRPVFGTAPPALERRSVALPRVTGVKVIDLFTPICEGQRIGLFAGPGVGKTTLLGMLARASSFDRVVLALVGERGREVRDLLDGLVAVHKDRTVAVVATSDQGPLMRRLAPVSAMCVAEHFRDAGERVLLLVDSLTRFALAGREVATSTGEIPVARGFPPSVFGDLAALLERAGPGPKGTGSITGVFTVLREGEDVDDPVAEAAKGILDGHIALSRAVAEAGRFPAVDVLGSLSRMADRAWTAEQASLVRQLRQLIFQFEDTRDMRLIAGAEQATADPALAQAVTVVPRIYAALCQGPTDPPCGDVFAELAALLRGAPAATACQPGTRPVA